MELCLDCDGTGHPEIKSKKPIDENEHSPAHAHAHRLRCILKGEEALTTKPWDYLRPLTAVANGCFATHEGATTDNQGVFPVSTYIAGSHYRGTHQQSALRNKNSGNCVLIVPEPANPCDPHAMAVMVAKGVSSGRFVWTHVGYIPASEARDLSRIWPRYRGRLLVGEGHLVGHPRNEKNPKIVIGGSFRNYFPD